MSHFVVVGLFVIVDTNYGYNIDDIISTRSETSLHAWNCPKDRLHCTRIS